MTLDEYRRKRDFTDSPEPRGSARRSAELEIRSPLPDFIPPQLPELTSEPPRGDHWVHELKMDGYRMQAQWRRTGFRFLTRSGNDWTNRYGVIADELSKLDWHDTILDGELTALDEERKSNFDLLQQAKGRAEVALAYFAFDLLCLSGEDFRNRPLEQRKAALKSLIDAASEKHDTSRLQYLDHITAGVDALANLCRARGLEGIVSKRIDRGYTSGRASGWRKTKFRYRESLIVVGYETSGEPRGLSSVLTGYYDEKDALHCRSARIDLHRSDSPR